jgi:hypothetical protein
LPIRAKAPDGRIIFELSDDGTLNFTSALEEEKYLEAATVRDAIDIVQELEDIEASHGDITQEVDLEQGDGPKKMDTSTNQKLVNGHRILHGWYDHPNRTSWTKDQVIREHTRVVRIMLKRGMKHNVHDALDDTLPSSLKKASRGEDKKEDKK